MILLFVASIVAVALILFFGKKLKPKMRVALVVLALLLVNLPTIVFLVVGDKRVRPRHDVASRSML